MKITVGNPLKQILKLAYQANQPPLLIGRHGLGKSEIFKQVAQELQIDFRVMDLSLMEPCDLVGIPKIKGEATRFVPPMSLPRSGKGILVFEELNRAQRYMQGPCLQLLTERKLNDYQLPPGWLPAAAINPASEGYHADELDAALLSRFSKIEVRPDRDEWVRWARENDVHSAVIDFVRGNPEIFSDEVPVSNPRAWKYVSNVLQAFDGDDHDTLYAMIEGLLDTAWATAFIRSFRGKAESPLSASEIIEHFETYRSIFSAWRKQHKLDLIRSSWLALKAHLQKQKNHDQLYENTKRLDNAMAFIKALPKDLESEAKAWAEERGYRDLC